MLATDIVDVVKEFVTLHKAGVNFKGLCPFHNERTPSFVVSPTKQLCKCFSCGKGGNAVHFLMEHEQVTYPEAIKWLGRKYGIEVQEKEMTPEERLAQNERESMFILNEWACSYFQEMLHKTEEGQTIGMSYFRTRGFRDDIIQKFQLGFSLEQSLLPNVAIEKGYKEEFLLKTGLCFQRNDNRLVDRYHGRVIFPILTVSGRVVAFGGRVLGEKKNVGKYVNSPESAIYNKSRELYGLFHAKQAIVKQDCCYLVEGYTDVISMHQSGVENVVASSGTSLTEGQVRLLHRFTSNITILYDGDKAGIKASLRGIDMLLSEGMNIRVLLLPEGEDPDSFARKQSTESFVSYIQSNQVNFIRFKIELLKQDVGEDPIKRAGMIADVVNSISVIPEGMIRQMYARECALLLNISEMVVLDEITKLRRRKRQEKALRQEKREEVKSDNVIESTEEEVIPTTHFLTQKPSNYEERLLTELIVRHGGRWFNIDGENLSVVHFIAKELANEELVLETELYHQIFHETIEIVQRHLDRKNVSENEEFIVDTLNYFLEHTDIQFSRFAVSCSDNADQLSKSQRMAYTEEKDRLEDFVFRILHDFKLARISKEMKSLRLQLQSPEIKNNPNELLELLKRIKALSEVERQLAQVLGDRVIAQ